MQYSKHSKHRHFIYSKYRLFIVGEADDDDANADANAEIFQSEDIDPSNHPSTAVPRKADGSPMLTSNDSLNRMLVASFQGFVKQYADQGEKLHSLRQGSSSSARPVHKSNTPVAAAKRSSRAPSPKMSMSVDAFAKSASPKDGKSFEVATDAIDYESYERLMDRTIRKTNQLIQTNSKNLRSLAIAIEEEEHQRELHYPQSNIAVKSRTDSYLHVPSVVHSPTSAFRSSGSGTLGGTLPVRRRSSSTSSKRKPKSAALVAESQYEDVLIQANKKGPAKVRQATSRYQVPSVSMESDEEGGEEVAASSKSKKKSKKSAKKKGASSSSPTRSFQNPTFSTSQRFLDLDQADVPYPYSYPTPMPPGIVPPLGLWNNNGLSRQNRQEYERMVKKMAIAGQLQSRNSAASASSSTFSNGKKK